MSEVKPIKIEEGKLKEITSRDQLPNDKVIDEKERLIALLVFELVKIGIPIENAQLLNLISKHI